MAEAAVNAGSAEAGTIVARDHAKWEKKGQPNKAELLVYAARKSGRNPIGLGIEMSKARRGRAKIQFDEYVKFGLYDKARFTDDERAQFVGAAVQNQVIHKTNDLWWFALTEDKWLSHLHLTRDGLPVPDTVAIVDTGARRYADGTVLRSADDLRGFLKTAGFPLFGKHNRGLMSVGVFIIENADDDMVYLREQGGMTYHKFLEHIIGSDAFLLQRLVRNCGFIRQFTEAAATIRMVNFLKEDGLWVSHAVLKLPSGGNLADNFWRPGNLLCNIDPETGKVLRLVGTDGPGLKELEAHPSVDAALLGETLPHWDRLLEVNAQVASLHTPLKYQSTDICITDDGPVIVEVNAGSSFSLPQYASGQGFLTPEIRKIFRDWGADMIWA
ncbi:hypothetical protein KUH32_15925 [Thalassococcus sp. CAU 1522]|uniref:Alpha-L-glutamate ligase-related protein ATP-grasp domain-containing protein n=1 Tax=Thalassococcus arenae TaxID=2851652 RepID=A0ABS6NB73_9RHOB|nr:sugar-transfer associated ATP-grasp domain-containing protein [Thalassococcus arenae]MBV2361253.1 hypothetical protein [Thalassococcus arenae]